ncbi:Adenylate kinase [Aquimarina amphilecti]|uniref:Adenylate kinase n=1 Tax=Aquimarina amphilecti TaxID=1038014 RepID=A0A1H7GF62_AQUAM|nr:AAA family ATPase [Aquimarina amphilecti]SEK36769.1 Adenylate kinase [Aquimarina amphilecti]
MKILIFGASGSGTTTLAKEVTNHIDFTHLDVDDYYWQKTVPAYQEKVPLAIRNQHLKDDINKYKNVIISGSMVNWGKEWETSFDLAIFIYLNNQERMNRLYKREKERYGEVLSINKAAQEKLKNFLDWANQYENPIFTGRSLKNHLNWIKLLNCKTLKIDGETSLKEKVESVTYEISKL